MATKIINPYSVESMGIGMEIIGTDVYHSVKVERIKKKRHKHEWHTDKIIVNGKIKIRKWCNDHTCKMSYYQKVINKPL